MHDLLPPEGCSNVKARSGDGFVQHQPLVSLRWHFMLWNASVVCGGSLLVASSTMLKSPIMMLGGGIVLLSILVSISFQSSVFSFGVFSMYTTNMFMLLFSGQFNVKLSVLPGIVALRFMGLLFILFLFMTTTMPLDLGFRGSYECMNMRFGLYYEFSFFICSLSEWDSRMLSTTIFLDS